MYVSSASHREDAGEISENSFYQFFLRINIQVSLIQSQQCARTQSSVTVKNKKQGILLSFQVMYSTRRRSKHAGTNIHRYRASDNTIALRIRQVYPSSVRSNIQHRDFIALCILTLCTVCTMKLQIKAIFLHIYPTSTKYSAIVSMTHRTQQAQKYALHCQERTWGVSRGLS